jgi:hypothetical protein
MSPARLVFSDEQNRRVGPLWHHPPEIFTTSLVLGVLGPDDARSASVNQVNQSLGSPAGVLAGRVGRGLDQKRGRERPSDSVEQRSARPRFDVRRHRPPRYDRGA